MTNLLLSHYMYDNRNTRRVSRMRNTSATGGGAGAGSASSGDAGGGGGTGGGTGNTGSTTGSTGTGTGAGTGSGSQSGTGTGTGTGAGTGSQPSGTDTGTGDIDGIRDGDFRTLRTKYSEVKTKAAQLEALGMPPEKALVAAKQYQTMETSAHTIGTELGYDKADIEAAFAADPVGLLNLLKQEKTAADAGRQTVPKTPEEQAQWLKDEVARQTAPISEHINKQISDAVTAKIGTEFDTHYKAALPDTPAEVRSLVEDYAIEYLKGDNASLVAMKVRGDYGAVKKVVDTVAARLKTTFAAWQAAEMKRTGQTRQTTQTDGGQQGTKRHTLDDFINDPGLINSRYSE